MPKESTRTKIEYTPDFEATWKLWPARNGTKQGKFEAFKTWRDLDIDLRRDIYAQVRDRQGRWGDKPKNFSSWLNQRGWEDDWQPEKVSSDIKKLRNAPSSLDGLIESAAQLLNTFCKHQVMRPWMFKGNHTSVTIPGCEECGRAEQTIYAQSHAENSLKAIKESTDVV